MRLKKDKSKDEKTKVEGWKGGRDERKVETKEEKKSRIRRKEGRKKGRQGMKPKKEGGLGGMEEKYQIQKILY